MPPTPLEVDVSRHVLVYGIASLDYKYDMTRRVEEIWSRYTPAYYVTINLNYYMPQPAANGMNLYWNINERRSHQFYRHLIHLDRVGVRLPGVERMAYSTFHATCALHALKLIESAFGGREFISEQHFREVAEPGVF